METWQLIVIILVILFSGGCSVAAILNKSGSAVTGEMLADFKRESDRNLDRAKKDIADDMEQQMRYLGENIRTMQRGSADQLSSQQEAFFGIMTEKQNAMSGIIEHNAKSTEDRFRTFESSTSSALSDIRETVEKRLSTMQADNDKHLDDVRDTMKKSLDEVRGVVDEKLQETLNKRITESFKLVNDRLSEVYQGLGEMKNLAIGVGDLKKVLSNVKTRGVLGEVQLGAILEEILTPEQFVKNFDAKRKSQERVEYAVRLPGNGDEPVWLPIDSKFPSDAYLKLLNNSFSFGERTVFPMLAAKEARTLVSEGTKSNKRDKTP